MHTFVRGEDDRTLLDQLVLASKVSCMFLRLSWQFDLTVWLPMYLGIDVTGMVKAGLRNKRGRRSCRVGNLGGA